MEICKVYFGGLSFAFFFGGVIFGFLSSLIFFNSKKNEQEELLGGNVENSDSEKIELDFNNRISNLLREFENCDEHRIRLESEIRGLQAIIDGNQSHSNQINLGNSSSLSSTNESLEPDSSAVNSSRDLQNTVLYFSIPSDHTGKFDLGNVKEIYDTKCHYSIRVLSNNRGELSYLTSDKDFRALDDYISHLSPVCEIVNFSDKSNSRNIQMLEKGQVYFENGSWVIDRNNKVKIRFI